VITTDERRHLLYELLFQNVEVTSIQITGIEVFGDRRQAPLARYDGPSLAAILQVSGGDPATGIVPPGGLGVAFLDITLPIDRHLPDDLAHEIRTVRESIAADASGPLVSVNSEEPRRVGPPLRGDGLFDAVGCCTGAHTRALFVKWLTRMTLADRRAPGPFTTRWYNDPVLDALGDETGASTPVWSVAPESLIVSPAPRETVQLGASREIWGWAWAEGAISEVHIRTSDEPGWQLANVEPAQAHEWQRFVFTWMPRHRGPVQLASRATTVDGTHQPMAGRRNAVHGVLVMVV